MNIKISHLVLDGCSFTYGDELEDPKTQSWGGLLAEKLGVPVVNLSSRGASNDKIMRTLFEYYYLDSQYNNHPFYIIAYTESSRREEYVRSHEDYDVVDMCPEFRTSDPANFSTAFILNYDVDIYCRRKLMIQTYIQNFLNNNCINYLQTDFVKDGLNNLKTLKKLLPKAYSTIYNDPYKIIDLGNLGAGFELLPNGHFNIEANKKMFEYVFQELTSKFTIEVVQKPYTSLAKYRNYYVSTGINNIDVLWE